MQQRWQSFRDAAQEEASAVLRAAHQGPYVPSSDYSTPSDMANEAASQVDEAAEPSAAAATDAAAAQSAEASSAEKSADQQSLPDEEPAPSAEPQKRPSRWAHLRDARRLMRQGPSRSQGAGFSALRQARDAARARHMDFSLREAAPLLVASHDVAAADVTFSEAPSRITFGTAEELSDRARAAQDEAGAENSGGKDVAEQVATDVEEASEGASLPAEALQDDAGHSSEEEVPSDAPTTLAAVPEVAPDTEPLPEEQEAGLELDMSTAEIAPLGSSDATPQAEPTAKPARAATANQGEPRTPKLKQRIHVKRPRIEEEDTGPRYKPGAQAVLDGGSQRGMTGWLSRQVSAAFKNVKVPQVGVESIRIRTGTLQVGLNISDHLQYIPWG